MALSVLNMIGDIMGADYIYTRLFPISFWGVERKRITQIKIEVVLSGTQTTLPLRVWRYGGYGLYSASRTILSLILGKYSTTFQAEVSVILACVNLRIASCYTVKHIIIKLPLSLLTQINSFLSWYGI